MLTRAFRPHAAYQDPKEVNGDRVLYSPYLSWFRDSNPQKSNAEAQRTRRNAEKCPLICFCPAFKYSNLVFSVCEIWDSLLTLRDSALSASLRFELECIRILRAGNLVSTEKGGMFSGE